MATAFNSPVVPTTRMPAGSGKGVGSQETWVSCMAWTRISVVCSGRERYCWWYSEAGDGEEVMQRLLSRFFSVFSGSSAKVFLLLVLAVADASIPLHIATLLLPLPLLLLLGALPNPKLSFQSPLSLKFSISVSPKQESKPPSYVIVVHIHINILNRSMLPISSPSGALSP